MNLSIKVEIFKEDDVYVALSPELNVSSFGETIFEAKESIKEAIEAFFEECREMGTLNEFNRPLVIKTSPRKVPVTHIRTNMTTAGMSRERYFELLEKVE